jgi:acetate---CoA ligase (ADP-forming)
VDRLFYPKSVAVIGVSQNPDNLARIIVENLIEFRFQGQISLVGKKEGILHGRKIYSSLDEIEEGIDVAVILTPAPAVPSILEACGRKRVGWAVIETAGFREYSDQGAALEGEVLRIAQKRGIRIVGPNGVGLINIENGFVVPFVGLKRAPLPKGRVSVLAQSGGICFVYLNLFATSRVGIAKIVSMGNKLDLNEIDYLRYLVRDPKTEIIGLYLESIERGRDLFDLARSTSKPIILHKANTGEASRQIARLHTAALANDDHVVDAAMKQADVVRVRNFRSFINAVKVLSLPPMKGDNMVILSRSGGIAIVAADSAEAHGFRLFSVGKQFRDQVHSYFRAKVIQPTNPLDLGDLFDFDLYTRILEEVLKTDKVHGVLFQHGATGSEIEPSRRLIQAIKKLSFRYGKPVGLCYMTEQEELARIGQTIDYPIFTEPDDALAALAISRDHYRKQKVKKRAPRSYPADGRRVRRVLQQAAAEKRDPLLPEALHILQAYGIPVAEYRVLSRKADLNKAMRQIGAPVALKLVSPAVSHKSERGAVILNLSRMKETGEAFDRLLALDREDACSVLMQEMIAGGKEVILGAKRDPSFGPVVLFGPGGIYVEALGESSLRVAPIARSDALEMISELKIGSILKGARGEPPVDMETLVKMLLRLSQLMIDFPEIEGIDINPVKALERGALALDARIALARPD